METDRIDRAWAAAAAGDWEEAKSHFEAIVDDEDPSAEVLDGLGRVLWWLKDVPGAIEIRSRAFTAYKDEEKTEQQLALRCGFPANCAVSFATTPRPAGGSHEPRPLLSI
jgi:tetratricopeptide (TPR) repeat protein